MYMFRLCRGTVVILCSSTQQTGPSSIASHHDHLHRAFPGMEVLANARRSLIMDTDGRTTFLNGASHCQLSPQLPRRPILPPKSCAARRAESKLYSPLADTQ